MEFRYFFCIYGCVILYTLYAICGLILLASAIYSEYQISPPILMHPYAWQFMIYGLAFANFIHSYLMVGGVFSIIALISYCIIIIVLEEFGLRSGLLFGKYHFSNSLGLRLTTRLPLIVVSLWLCLIYPAALLASRIIHIQPSASSSLCNFKIRLQTSTSRNKILFIVLLSSILAGYDIVCEPVAFLQGHKLWTHYLQPGANLSNFNPQPDWYFPEATSSLNFGSNYFNLPLSNTIGWLLTGMAIGVSIIFTSSFDSQRRNDVSPYFVKLYDSQRAASASNLSFSLLEFIYHLPIIIALLSNQIFYIVHPGHPFAVRCAGFIYLLILYLTDRFMHLSRQRLMIDSIKSN